MKYLLSFLLLAVAAASVAVASERGERASAEHDTHVTRHIPVVNTRYKADDTGLGRVIVAVGSDRLLQGDPLLARHLIVMGRGAEHAPIPVCSESQYRDKTKKAVAMWNDGIKTIHANAQAILKFYEHTDPANCPANVAGKDSMYIVIQHGDCNAGEDEDDEARVVACSHPPEGAAGAPRYARLGRQLIEIQGGLPGGDKGYVAIAHEIGHVLGFAHQYEPTLFVRHPSGGPGFGTKPYSIWTVNNCPGASGGFTYTNVEAFGQEISPPRTVTSAGDIPYLPEQTKNRLEAVLPAVGWHGGALMLPLMDCVGDKRKSDHEWEYKSTPRLHTYDLEAFKQAYEPPRVANVTVKDAARSGYVRVSWDASDVHNEKEFAVQAQVRYDAADTTRSGGTTALSAWVTVATAAADESGVTFQRPRDNRATRPFWRLVTDSSTYATYRVVSVTDAFGSRPALDYAISLEVDHDKPRRAPVACTQPLTVNVQGSDSHEVSVRGHRSVNGNVYAFGCSSTATLVADAPGAGETFTWLGDCNGSELRCDVIMLGSRTATAVYSAKGTTPPRETCPVKPTLTVNVKGHATATVTVSGHQSKLGNVYTFGCDDKATLTASSETTSTGDAYSVRWSGDCSGSTHRCKVDMGTSAKSATVTYSRASVCQGTKRLTLTPSPTAGGSVTASPSKTSYACGDAVTITATPSSGYEVASWSAPCSGSGETCTVTMNATTSVRVTFARETTPGGNGGTDPKPLTLTVSHGANGTTSPAAGTHNYKRGATATVTARPARGYEVASWSGDCSGSATSCTLTMNANKTAHVTFVRETPGGGTPTVTPTDTFSIRTRTVTAPASWRWSVSCAVGGGSGGTASSRAAANSAAAARLRSCPVNGSVSTSSTTVTTWGWTATCFDQPASSGGSGYATWAAANAALNAWADATCIEEAVTTGSRVYRVNTKTWSYAASCSPGLSSSGGGYSSAGTASDAGWIWVENSCVVRGTSSVTSSGGGTYTQYGWTASCAGGSPSGANTAWHASRAAALTEARAWIARRC